MGEEESFRCKLVTWAEIQHWCDELAYSVEQSNWRPDAVVALTRGGLVPARIVCDHFTNKNLYTVKVEHWGVTAHPDGEAKLTSPLGQDLTGKKVLVVDDITDTGKSLTTAIDHIQETGNPAEIRGAAMLHLTASAYRPDFFAHEQSEWTWFVFPWNLYEDLTHLTPKTLSEPRTPETAAAALETQFQISPPPDVIQRVLDRLVVRGDVSNDGGTYSANEPAN